MTLPRGLFEHVPAVAKKRRKETGMTQREVAQRAGVSTTTVSRIEKGAGVSGVLIDRVLRALGLDWLEALTAFAQAARVRPPYVVHDQLGEAVAPAPAPIVLRLVPGDMRSVAFEVQTGHRRLLLSVNVYDYTPHLQSELFSGD